MNTTKFSTVTRRVPGNVFRGSNATIS